MAWGRTRPCGVPFWPLARCGSQALSLAVPAGIRAFERSAGATDPIPFGNGLPPHTKMVVEAVVVGVDGTAPEAPGWVTISYQLSRTEHTTRDGKLEMARLENEAALGVSFTYTGAFRARLRAANGGTVIEATPPGIDGIFENLSDGEYLLEVEKDPDATFQPHVNDAMAQRMRDMGASAAVDGEDEDDDAFETALAARMAAMAATEHDAGCDDGVVEPLVEASMPPVVADAPVGNDVEAVKDEWSRIPGRVTVKYNVEEGEYHTTDGVLSMREIDEDLAISFAFSGAFRARLKSNEFGHVLVASPTGIDGLFEGVFRGGYTLEIDEDPVVPIADSIAYVAPAAVEETLGTRDEITAELRAMDADTLRAQGPEYQQLLVARDAEGVLSEMAS